MAIRNESYKLIKSPQFNLPAGGENRTDVVLPSNPDVRNGVITGFVTTGETPLDDVVIKVLTTGGNPIDHTYSNANGAYTTDQLQPGIYNVVASRPGFLTSAPITVNLPLSTIAAVNFNLSPDPLAVLNNLYGLVLDQSTGNRISGSTVILTDQQGITVATTTTNNDGQYLLCDTANGSYLISAVKTGYEVPTPLPVTVTGGQLARTNVSLTPDLVTEATVQGFIRDESSNALSGAFVGLYAVSGGIETLLQTTYTNSNGFYLFGNLPGGNYLVKAKADVLV